MTNRDGMKRVSVNFSPSTYKALEDLAEEKGGSMADALRDAIAISKWFHKAQEDGRVLIEKDGNIREIMKF